MTRYFIGLMVPPALQEPLTAFAASLESALPQHHPYKLSWNAPEDLHCTLVFIGQTDHPEQHLAQQMRRVAAQLAPATITIRGATHWLGRNSLALAATGAERTGTTFVEALGHLSSDNRAERRPFYGHVTLGRVRPVPPSTHDPFAGRDIEPLTWTATSVQLMKSRDNPTDERRYDIVTHARFGDR